MRELKDLTVKGMALVKSPANRKRFLMAKSESAADQSAQSGDVTAAPSDVVNAVRAIKLAKGENEAASDALEAVAHLLHGSDLSLADVLAASQAAGLADIEKAAPKKKDQDEEEWDEEDEDIENDEDEDDEDEDDGSSGKKMPPFLKRKLEKAEWDEAAHPRAENGRFGTSAGGSDRTSKEARSASEKAFKSNSADDHADAADAHAIAADLTNGDLNQQAHATSAAEHRMEAAKLDGGQKAIRDSSAAASAKAAEDASKKANSTMSRADHLAAAKAHSNAKKDSMVAVENKEATFAHVGYHQAAAEMHSHLGVSPRLKKSQFADSSANQGEAEMADIEKSKDRQFVSKSEYDKVVAEIAKAHERLEKMEHDDAVRAEKSANQGIYGDLKVDHDALARTTLALRKSAPKDLEALEATLKAANEQVRVAKTSGGSIFRASSSQPHVGHQVAKRQGDQFKQLVDDYIAKNAGVSREQAIANVAKSADAVNHFNQLQAEA